MILQRLAEHYDRIVAEGKAELAPPGSSLQKVSFCIVLTPEGELHSFEDLRQSEGKFVRPRNLVLPGQSKPPGAGINPRFLWDSAEYLLGWSADPGKKERAPKTFTAFRDMHLALEQTLAHPAFTAVCNFLRAWSPQRAESFGPELADKATNFGVFRVLGDELRYVHEQVAPPTESGTVEEQDLAYCLVSGELAPAARLHEPKIKGVKGSQTSGALLVSFNSSSFTSYGKDQSFNAPVSVGATFRYTNALNHLLDPRQKRRIILGDATVVFWADHATVVEDAFFEALAGWGGDSKDAVQEDQTRVNEARVLLTQMRDGTTHATRRPDDQPTRFFILGLSPNASRLSVRLWVEQDAAELERHLARHVRDLALAGSRDARMLSARQIIEATGRAEREKAAGRLKGYDTKAVSPQLAGEIARSIVTGAPYPQSLLATMVRRIRADNEVAFARVSAIKAVLVRNSRLAGKPLEIPMELNEQETDIAYRCGRLFAVLEKAQSDSLGGDLNATVKDRYFASASTTPALVYPRLFRLNGHHLAKLDQGPKIFYHQLISSLMAAPFDFPRQLNLLEQGRFIIGYFQQRQIFYTPKKEKAPQPEATAA